MKTIVPSQILDTSNIVDGRQELLNTRKAICCPEGESEHRMIREAPKGSYLRSVREVSKRNNAGRLCTFSQKVDSFFKLDLYKTLLLFGDVNLFAGAYMMSNIAQDGETFYYMSHEYFKLGMVQYFRRDIDEVFLKMPTLHFQFGFQDFLQNQVKLLFSVFEFRIPTFYSKQQYVDSFSYSEKQNNLNVDFFLDTFACFLITLSSIVSLFLIYRLIKFSLRSRNIDMSRSKGVQQLVALERGKIYKIPIRMTTVGHTLIASNRILGNYRE